MPAKSKHVLLNIWTKPVEIRDVASFITFEMFYMKWIPFFEIKVLPLRKICNSATWNTKITPLLWEKDAKDTCKFVIDVIVSDACLAWWDSCKRSYLQSKYCNKDMGFVGVCNPPVMKYP